MKKYESEEARKQAERERKRRWKQENVEVKQAQEKRRKARRRAEKASGWTPSFVGVDGESFLTGKTITVKDEDGTVISIPEQSYCLLYRSDLGYTLYNSQGLSTYDCLDYLTSKKLENKACVGFFLNFDCEWILKDLAQEDYKRLQSGEEVIFGEYKLSWIPHKRLMIQKERRGEWAKPQSEREYYRATVLQDAKSFFQTSFVSALIKWGFKDDERLKEIIEGKKARGDFEHSDYDTIESYNKMELILLEELMLKVYEAFLDAYTKTEMEFRANKESWSGPGWFAADFLTQTNWIDEHAHVEDFLCAEFWETHESGLPNDFDSEVYAMSHFLRDTELMKQSNYLIDQIKEAGGIRIRTGSAFYSEWIESVPLSVRRRVSNSKGRPLDETAEIFHMSARELIDALSEANPYKPRVKDFLEEAAKTLKRNLRESANFPYPFTLAYFGGRIELAGIGRFENVVNYDINSAYPYALSLLPTWASEDFKWYRMNPTDFEDQDMVVSLRPMGMVHIQFEFPHGWQWYPFPVRRNGNVFYPRTGDTWVMTPEFFAMWDTLEPEERNRVVMLDALVLDKTDGYGDAMQRMPEERLCTTAKKTLELAKIRLELKKQGGHAEKALKLILNSLYGKTIQQVGKHRYFNDFAASWITSTCRALLWRAMSEERHSKHAIMCMTDGLYSTKPLNFPEQRITNALGAFEKEEFEWLEAFKPGIYRYKDSKGIHYKVRGFLTPEDKDREELFRIIGNAMRDGKKYTFPARAFLSRNLCLEGWKREPFARQFIEIDKDIESELRAKRSPNPNTGWRIPETKDHVYFIPKMADFPISECYELNFQDLAQPEDESYEEMEEYLDRVAGHYRLEEYEQ